MNIAEPLKGNVVVAVRIIVRIEIQTTFVVFEELVFNLDKFT